MQTLYDQLQRYRSFSAYDELFVTDIWWMEAPSPAWSACTPAARDGRHPRQGAAHRLGGGGTL